jgi:hypothetical protein
MDEKRTLSILGWMMGSLLAAAFLLNAMAMSGGTPPARPHGIATDDLGYGVVSDGFESAAASSK